MIYRDRQIICKFCHKETGYTEEGIRYMVIPGEGLKCKSCDQVFLKPKDVMLSF